MAGVSFAQPKATPSAVNSAADMNALQRAAMITAPVAPCMGVTVFWRA